MSQVVPDADDAQWASSTWRTTGAMVGEVAGTDARRSMENEREGHGQQGSSARNGGEAYLSAWAVMWWSRGRIAEAMISLIVIEVELEKPAPDLWLCQKKRDIGVLTLSRNKSIMAHLARLFYCW